MSARPRPHLRWGIPLLILLVIVLLLVLTPIGPWLARGAGQTWRGFMNLPGMAWLREKSQVAPATTAKAEEEVPPDLRAALEEGSKLQEQGAYEQALERYREALQLDDKSAPAHYALASVYRQLGRTEEALQELQKAAELAPDNPLVQRQLGLAYLEQEDYDQAVIALKAAQAADPQEPLDAYYLGLAYYSRSHADAENAVQAMESAAKLAPDDADVQFHLAMVYVRRDEEGDTEKAAAALRQTLVLDPERTEAYNYLGQLYMKSGQRDAAIEAWQAYVAKSDDAEGVARVRGWLSALEE